jgi:betaine-aldehyde dehydrogenase
MSTYSFDEYTQVKHVMSALSGEPRKSWHDVVFTSGAGGGDGDGDGDRIMTA